MGCRYSTNCCNSEGRLRAVELVSLVSGLQDGSTLDQTVLIKEGPGTTPTSYVTIGFDGLMEPVNPGGIGVGAFVLRENGMVMRRVAMLAGKPGDPDASNNVAEYTGVIAALEYLTSIGFHGKAVIMGDSQVVIYQLIGRYQVRSPNLFHFHARAQSLLRNLRDGGAVIIVKWVPRDENADADSATREGFVTFLKNFRGSATIEHVAVSPPSGKVKRDAKVISCDSVDRKGENLFGVPSSVSNEVYEVDISALTCTCQYFTKRHRPCKHITLVIDCLLDKNMRVEGAL